MPKMIAPKNFFLLLRAPTSKQERLLLQSLAGQHKHQDFFIASCCGIVSTTISIFPNFVLRMCLLVVSGVLRRCRAASAVFPVTSQPAEEFLVVGCQQWETPSVCSQPLYVCPTTLLAPIIREKDIFLASNVECYPLYHRIFCLVWTPPGGVGQSQWKLHHRRDSRQWCERQPPCFRPAYLWDANHGGRW